MVAILLFREAYAPGQKLVGVIPHLQATPGLKLRMLGGALVYDRTRANPRNFNATHWIGHASAMEHGTIFFDLKIPLSEPDEQGCASFTAQLPDTMLPSFSSAYNTAFVTVSYGLCLHSESGEVLSVEPVTMTQNAPEESGRMNKKTRLATFVTRNLNWCARARPCSIVVLRLTVWHSGARVEAVLAPAARSWGTLVSRWRVIVGVCRRSGVVHRPRLTSHPHRQVVLVFVPSSHDSVMLATANFTSYPEFTRPCAGPDVSQGATDAEVCGPQCRYYHSNSSYLAATVDMDEVDNLTSGSTLSLRLHARSIQVRSRCSFRCAHSDGVVAPWF